MYKLSGHSLTKGTWFIPETQPMILQERDSTCSITLGPDAPAIAFDDWLLDDEWPDGLYVWRVKGINDDAGADTKTVELEHVIKILDDLTLGEVTVEDIAGSGATTCSAQAAAAYILSKTSDWTLGDFEYGTSNPYEFNGETLYDALETVTDTLDNAVWEYDLSVYPFKVHIRQRDNAVRCEMRGERNLSSLKRSVSRSGMYTRIYPTGKNDLHIDGDYLSKNEGLYGRVDHRETDQSKSTKENLQAWAQGRLNRHCEPTVSITITGLELSQETGETLDNLKLNKICQVPLPEYATTITERIVKKQWRDRRKEPENVTLTLANNVRDISSIVKEQTRGGSGGRAGAGQAKQNYLFEANGEHLLYEVFDECGHVHGLLRMTSESLRIAFENLNDSTRSEFLLTAESLRIQFENEISSTRSEFQMTSESLRIQFENELASTRSEFQMTSESMRIHFENEISSTRSEMEMTSESMRLQFENDLSSLRSDLQMTAESLRISFNNEASSLRSELQMSAESLRIAFTTADNSLRSEFQLTASSLRVEFQSEASSMRSLISANASAILLKVSKGDVGTQLAVELGNVSISGGNLVVDGYVKTSELDATFINGLFTGSQVFSSNYGFIRNLECTNFTQGEYSMDLSDAVTGIKLELDGNTYKLSEKHFYSGSTWSQVGTFSRAISSDSWSWVGGSAKVTLQPQNQSFFSKSLDYIGQHGSVTWDNDYKGFTVRMDVDDTDGTTVFHDNVWFSTATAYAQGVAEGEGEFTQASIILEGTAYGNITPIGTAHKFTYTHLYKAGTAATYYKGNGTSVTGRGDSVNVTPIGTAHKFTYTHLYKAGSGKTYYKGNGSTVTGRGTGYTITPIGTEHKLKYTHLYDAQGNTQWAYVTDNNGTTKWYSKGTDVTVYPGNGSTVTGRGDSVSVTEQGDDQWAYVGDANGSITYYSAGTGATYYKGNGASVTDRGDSVSVTEQGDDQWAYVGNANGSITYYSAGTVITGLRNAGTQNTTDYYTKTS